MKRIFLILSICCLLSGCKSNSGGKDYDTARSESESPVMSEAVQTPAADEAKAPEAKPLTVQAGIDKKKIIKDGAISLKVKDLEECKIRIDTLLRKNNAYYSHESLNNTDYESTYNLTIRIPSVRFESFIDGVDAAGGEVVYKNIEARDVTEEFVDLETRLVSKRNYLNRYGNLVHQANSVEEILQIEEKARIIEEEIESAEGRLKYLADQVAFSTLELTISKAEPFKFKPKHQIRFFEKFKQSVAGGWYGFLVFLLFLFKIWPVWVLFIIAVIIWRITQKRQQRKK